MVVLTIHPSSFPYSSPANASPIGSSPSCVNERRVRPPCFGSSTNPISCNVSISRAARGYLTRNRRWSIEVETMSYFCASSRACSSISSRSSTNVCRSLRCFHGLPVLSRWASPVANETPGYQSPYRLALVGLPTVPLCIHQSDTHPRLVASLTYAGQTAMFFKRNF